jgi:prefoldin subunit 5
MKMIENFDLKSKVIVDLKSGIIIEEGGKENIELPLILMEYLSSNLGHIEK